MNIRDIINLAAEAWKRIKAASDPDFNESAHSFRESLVHQAESVVRLRAVGNRTNNPSPFEATVEAILDERDAAAKAEKPVEGEGQPAAPPAEVIEPPAVVEQPQAPAEVQNEQTESPDEAPAAEGTQESESEAVN